MLRVTALITFIPTIRSVLAHITSYGHQITQVLQMKRIYEKAFAVALPALVSGGSECDLFYTIYQSLVYTI